MDFAPMCVPIEIRRAEATGQRFFRLGLAVALDRISLRSKLPDDLVGPPLFIRFQLPPPTSHGDHLSEDFDDDLTLCAVAGETAELVPGV